MVGPRYYKPCAKCGQAMGPWPLSRCHRQTYCSTRCAGTMQYQVKSPRTLKVIELGRASGLTRTAIGKLVGLSQPRITAILQACSGSSMAGPE